MELHKPDGNCRQGGAKMTSVGVQLLLQALVCLCLSSCHDAAQFRMNGKVQDRMTKQAAFLSSEKMQVITLGTGGPLPNQTRVSSGTAIIAGGEFVLVDVGPGVVRNMNLSGLPAGKLGTLLLTHFHSDHIAEMGELDFTSWAQGRDKKLDVYGPQGVEQVVTGYNTAYAQDSSYRTAHHGEDCMPSKNSGMVPHTLTIPDPEKTAPFFDRNGLKISAFKVDHSPVHSAVGYRFDYRGRVVVISGDTVKTPALVNAARDADILLCEGLNREMMKMISKAAQEANNPRLSRQMIDVLDYHMSPVEAAEVAQEAGVKKLILIHVVPPVENSTAKKIYLKGTAEAFGGEIVLGEDMASYELDPK